MSSVSATAEGPRFPTSYRTWLLTLLVAIYACSFIDRIILATVGQAIKVELKLSDFQFGLLTGAAFALFYALFGMPIAWLAERTNRINIISVCIALWSAMTMLCGTAHGYWQLLAYRMGVGLGEGGCSPAAHSLLSDHYPPRKRAAALAIYSIGVPLGSMIGAMAGGVLAETFSWRTAFLVVGAPGLILALIARITLREPPRGHSEVAAVARKAPSTFSVFGRLLKSTSFRHMAAGCVLTNLAANGVNQFAPSYLVRTFHMHLGEVGQLYGLVIGASGTLGMLIGGYGSDLGARRDPRWYGWIGAVGSIAALPMMIWAFTRTDPYQTAWWIFGGSLALSLYFAPTFAVIQNLVEPRMRATASAVMLLLMNIFGQGLGPAAMGWISDTLAGRMFTGGGDFLASCPGGLAPKGSAAALTQACAISSATGLKYAILVSTVFFLWGAFHYAWATRTLKREITSVS